MIAAVVQTASMNSFIIIVLPLQELQKLSGTLETVKYTINKNYI